MKKIIYSLLASLFMLASCSQEEYSAGQTDGEKVTVTLATDDEPMSRSGGAGIVDRYIIEVYSDATFGTPANVFGSTNQATSTDGTFSLALDRTKEYYCLFWADKKVDGAYIYNTASLQAISVIDGKNPIEASYCGTQAITSKQATYTVTLGRAVGKINLKEKGSLPAGTKLTMTFNQAKFSVATGRATKDDAKRTEIFTLAAGANGVDVPQIINDREIYTFANRTGNYVASFTFQCDEEESFDVNNVPMQANYVMNIIGHYTKNTAQTFTITCSDNWSTIDDGDIALSYFANEKTLGIDGSSAEKAYEIANAVQLKLLAIRVNGDDAANWNTKYYKLTENIDLSTVCGNTKGSWVPIGKSKELPFKGHFDGNGKTISNLYIENKADYQALFGCINNAEVKGMTVEGSVKGRIQVAGIVAYSTKGTIYNCTNKATVVAETVNISNDFYCAAGIVGMTENSTDVSYCINSGTISCTLNSTTSAACTPVSGGIAGFCQSESAVKGCVNTGNVNVYSGNTTRANAGGIAGKLNRATISCCYNTGDIANPTLGDFSASGGMTGDANVAVFNGNFGTGKVTCGGFAGGLLGYSGSRDSESVIFNSDMFVSISDGATEGIGKVISGTKPVLNPVADIAAINSGVAAMNNSIKTWNAGNTPSTWTNGNKPVAGTAHECKFHFIAGSGNSLPTIVEGAPSN